MPNPESRPNLSPIMDLSFSFGKTEILRAAIQLDIFTLIDNGNHTAADLAKAAGAKERGMRILCDSLVGLQALEKDGNRYVLNDAARTFLSRNSRAFMGDWVNHMDQIKQNWTHIADVVRTGVAPQHVDQEKFGAEFFSKFVGSLFVMSKPGAEAAAERVVGNRRGLRVLDVGAGSGVWGISMAQRDPEARVTVADFERVTEVTKRFAAQFGMTDRFEYLTGDFRQTDFGEAKYDVATVGHILHSEGERRSKDLLKKIRRALKPDGQIVIGEFLADEERKNAEFPLMFAVNMLVNTEEGDTFTFNEISQWLRDAGFGEVDTLNAPAPSPLIIGKVAAQKRKPRDTQEAATLGVAASTQRQSHANPGRGLRL